MLEYKTEIERAEETLMNVVRESRGTYSPRQVLDQARSDYVSESVLRSAMLRLLDEHKIQLGRDRKLSVCTSQE